MDEQNNLENIDTKILKPLLEFKLLEINFDDIFRFEKPEKVKVRFNLWYGEDTPYYRFCHGKLDSLIDDHYNNEEKQGKIFPDEGMITMGFVLINGYPDYWLLVHVSQINKILKIGDKYKYEYEEISGYQEYIGNFVIKYHKRHRAEAIYLETLQKNGIESYRIEEENANRK